MLKYVLLFALVATCFCDEIVCPSGKNDTEMEASCLTKQYAWGNCTVGNSSDNVSCLADAVAMGASTELPKATDCASATKAFDDMNLNSTDAKAFVSCMLDTCGCTGATTVFGFGLLMLFGIFSYLMK